MSNLDVEQSGSSDTQDQLTALLSLSLLQSGESLTIHVSAPSEGCGVPLKLLAQHAQQWKKAAIYLGKAAFLSLSAAKGFRFCIKGGAICRTNLETRSSSVYNIHTKTASQLIQPFDQNTIMSAIILTQLAPSTPVLPVSLAEAIRVTTITTLFSEPATPFSALEQFESIVTDPTTTTLRMLARARNINSRRGPSKRTPVCPPMIRHGASPRL
ncbi:hypothetical protein B0H11DRAFT_2235090 [Mycena galericulata]|nr:hypothetical protein B0H11DRAFT_2235090 [Mycena galericulata]